MLLSHSDFSAASPALHTAGPFAVPMVLLLPKGTAHPIHCSPQGSSVALKVLRTRDHSHAPFPPGLQ